jgi:exodeoxyribonuclease VII small subunit
MKQKISYTEAFSELENIVNEIEQGEISVDKLSEKVKRASLLVKVCKDKLTSTEEDVNRILEELQEEDMKEYIKGMPLPVYHETEDVPILIDNLNGIVFGTKERNE